MGAKAHRRPQGTALLRCSSTTRRPHDDDAAASGHRQVDAGAGRNSAQRGERAAVLINATASR
ncbi:MAG: hypothetical protein LBC35_07810 [Coriobacteriales bacterium]|nr:hypothetical protein [Coriobacteriales bacterium]